MKSQIVILAILSASVSALTGTQCDCSEITVQNDCLYGGCIWITVDGNGSCQGSTKAACNTYKTQSSCDEWAGCAWTNAGACADFTKCEDYTVPTKSGSQCQAKDTTCIPGTVNSGNVVCKAGTLSCADITDADVCKSRLMIDFTTACWWINSKCAIQDVSKCSIFADSELCQAAECVYVNNTCTAPKCADQTEVNCADLRAEEKGKIQVCKWGTACADVDATTLTQTTCATGSSLTYAWNGSACSACTGKSSSYSMLLTLIGMLALLLF